MNPSTKAPSSSASWIPPSAFPAGATVSFTGSGDVYQVQDDGSLRVAVPRLHGKRERREARRRRAEARFLAKAEAATQARGQPET